MMIDQNKIQSNNNDIQALKIMEHKRKYERKREDNELKARKERIRKAKEEYERQKQVIDQLNVFRNVNETFRINSNRCKHM